MRVLLIEDEPDLARLLSKSIAATGLVVDCVGNLAQARNAAVSATYALAVLDRRLPDGDGLSVISLLRKTQPDLPIIVLTALDTVHARVEGLDCGADDYMTKPFANDELLARIRAAMRRRGGAPQRPIICGAVCFDMVERTVTMAGAPVALSRRELGLLEALMLRVGRVIRRAALMEQLYSFDDEVQDNALDALVSRLRRSCSVHRAGVEIITVRGVGYLLRAGTA